MTHPQTSTPTHTAPQHKRLGFFSRLLDEASAAERYQLVAAQIRHAEAHGFDSAWVAQHHFHEHEGGLPAPLVFLAYLAAQTQRIRLGTGIITLPLENALRVAEDAAVLDLLANGRLEVGVGTGGTPASFSAFGLDSEQRREIFAGQLATLRRAWAGAPLAGGDRIYPAAEQLLGRLWQATFSAGGAALAGAAGDGLMLSRTQPRSAEAPQATLAQIQHPIIDSYLAALPAGRAPRIVASRSLFVADDRAEALRLAEVGLRRSIARSATLGKSLVPADAPLAQIIAAYDVHVGTVADVVASLRADTTLERVSDIVFQVHSIDPPQAQILRSIELIATEVAPALGWRAAVSTPTTTDSPLEAFA
ncbi:putative FMN-dependent luciferase-like monooxygenase [Acidovorax sp. CCYZU-2555]|uniref:putative FMN-dependent luciferase-like monooxygenase n=1 Tax=Acidovorax sp. CCYZU-2555 TaxID=2835042 RepID=UPI001BCB6CA5|nr:putative FMN-dependent luciferase-like monooxygenase [Acidovorax sp. CCYZU-2555]MBS7778766.1 putative FMN-dependent luciferase-like monooxygenase [Acidovorax sp. CCYZU-2555]